MTPVNHKNLIDVSEELKKIYDDTENIIKTNTRFFLGVNKEGHYLTTKEFFSIQKIIIDQLNKFMSIKTDNKLILAEFENKIKDSIILKAHILSNISNNTIDLVDI